MLKNPSHGTIQLKDYQAPQFELQHCALSFDLDPLQTRVTAEYQIQSLSDDRTLILDGESLELLSIEIDSVILSAQQYQLDEKTLSIPDVPDSFTLRLQTLTRPADNTSLNGLYQSADMLCTQCEAQGFRRITYAMDRPDVLTTYTVTLNADKARYPVLLSNGNLIEEGGDADRHYAVWDDPFPKPTYLFALVAGELSRHSDQFTTRSGRVVDLHVLTRADDAGKTGHAMASLQRAMRWDEQAFDREYDLDIYHIVAVGDFNMGAMENKSLNIFNTKYVLARSEIATDQDYHAIEGVIGHEYFHNWSGNRVTCRDWFQLSLKEGFTVFRDHQFSADMGSSGVQRIDNVSVLRNVQFKEDEGPMAHPIRPDSYEEINNFYTATVYEKGAEVVRMLHTLLGEAAFKQACNLYFRRFDGQAVTTDDFIDVMQESSDIDLQQFRLWYSQAGTPCVSLKTEYDDKSNTLRLYLKQSTPDTPGQTGKAALLIPLKTALFDAAGDRLEFSYQGELQEEAVISLTTAQQSIELTGVSSEPVVSILRGFSAPVKLDFDQDQHSLMFLARHDDDAFNRWEAMQRLSLIEIEKLIEHEQSGTVSEEYIEVYASILNDHQTDPALLARMLTLPAESFISQRMEIIDPDRIHQSREQLIRIIAQTHKEALFQRYVDSHALSTGNWTPAETGQRALRDACLAILFRLENAAVYALACKQYEQSNCMTDIMAALACLTRSSYSNKQGYLDDFHRQWHAEDLLINKWLSLQSQQMGANAMHDIEKLTLHHDFDLQNPNKVYALIGGMLFANAVTFHAQDGSGYRFAAEWILKLDAINPQVAARMVGCFNQWKRYDLLRQGLMQSQMRRIAAHPELSDNVSEIINKALALEDSDTN